MISHENGADAFMFSVSERTLSILQAINEKMETGHLALYAIVPYAYEYVRLATQVGMAGLAKRIAGQIVLSGKPTMALSGLKGLIGMDPVSLLKTYLLYEIRRTKSSAGKMANLDSLLLHEVITDMALALDLSWLFQKYIDIVSKLGINPGFQTRNFVYLVDKFRSWDIDFQGISIAAPFNKVGFQMSPSRVECERVLTEVPESTTIAISILAAGYLKLPEAASYIRALPNLKGIVAGVSKEHQACETFRFLKESLQG